MAEYYRIVRALTTAPLIDLKRKLTFAQMSVEQLAAVIRNDTLPIWEHSHRTRVISATAKKSATAEWRRRHARNTSFGVNWATKAHQKAFGQ